jgi:hypothetical protein
MLRSWGQELNARPEDAKLTVKGKIEAGTYAQTRYVVLVHAMTLQCRTAHVNLQDLPETLAEDAQKANRHRRHQRQSAENDQVSAAEIRRRRQKQAIPPPQVRPAARLHIFQRGLYGDGDWQRSLAHWRDQRRHPRASGAGKHILQARGPRPQRRDAKEVHPGTQATADQGPTLLPHGSL